MLWEVLIASIVKAGFFHQSRQIDVTSVKSDWLCIIKKNWSKYSFSTSQGRGNWDSYFSFTSPTALWLCNGLIACFIEKLYVTVRQYPFIKYRNVLADEQKWQAAFQRHVSSKFSVKNRVKRLVSIGVPYSLYLTNNTIPDFLVRDPHWALGRMCWDHPGATSLLSCFQLAGWQGVSLGSSPWGPSFQSVAKLGEI